MRTKWPSSSCRSRCPVPVFAGFWEGSQWVDRRLSLWKTTLLWLLLIFWCWCFVGIFPRFVEEDGGEYTTPLNVVHLLGPFHTWINVDGTGQYYTAINPHINSKMSHLPILYALTWKKLHRDYLTWDESWWGYIYKDSHTIICAKKMAEIGIFQYQPAIKSLKQSHHFWHITEHS